MSSFSQTDTTKPINNIDDKSNEPIAPIKLTNAASNYDQNQELSASQKQQLEQQIINEVKNYEQSQFQELGEDNPILKSKNNLESKKNQENDGGDFNNEQRQSKVPSRTVPEAHIDPQTGKAHIYGGARGVLVVLGPAVPPKLF